MLKSASDYSSIVKAGFATDQSQKGADPASQQQKLSDAIANAILAALGDAEVDAPGQFTIASGDCTVVGSPSTQTNTASIPITGTGKIK